ncbi:hypothetical protein C0W38_12805 [Photobacterium angustum]|nr:hypothetical protein UA33_20920 [Photobacterium angustum]KJG19910.1 hypothetical protein UA39_20840 [Photobacterium angustum]KJG27078.1 hypothetical protein UA36_20905 [Photobacterium angustum]PSW96881.1 hypothetical protein C0W79_01045 [Photobacterium angustum]PSX03713.1 hypothetical protein C0W87_03195 [Photobacterium angustum]
MPLNRTYIVKKKIVISSLIISVTILISLYIKPTKNGETLPLPSTSSVEKDSNDDFKTSNVDKNKNFNYERVNKKEKTKKFSTEEEKYITYQVENLKSSLGSLIKNVKVQSELWDFKQEVINNFNVNGNAIFNRIISLSFPMYEQSILKLMNSMDIYNKWLFENLSLLNNLNGIESQKLLWQERYKIFKEDAELIWDPNTTALNTKKSLVVKTISLLDKSTDIEFEDRLFIIKNSIENLELSTQESNTQSKTIIEQVFFNLESVQKEMQLLTPQERAEKIANARREIGFTEDQVALAAEQDAEKSARWDIGMKYMKEREQLLRDVPKANLKQKLKMLRTKYFGDSADTYDKEEKRGFYRFERQRIYGVNS